MSAGIGIFSPREYGYREEKRSRKTTCSGAQTVAKLRRSALVATAHLNLLASHLMLWHAKYEAWIPSNNKHALLYMEDEEEHGLGFPHGVDDIIAGALHGMKVGVLNSAGRRLKGVFNNIF